MTETDLAPDCLACGACCFSTLDRYVRVTGDDYARLGDDAETLVRFIEHRAYLELEDGHCAALSIDLLLGRFVCTVYEKRPSICRQLGRGSAECRGERHLKGGLPRAALGRARH
jgi:Fe-S-cluster containining protein